MPERSEGDSRIVVITNLTARPAQHGRRDDRESRRGGAARGEEMPAIHRGCIHRRFHCVLPYMLTARTRRASPVVPRQHWRLEDHA